MGQLNCMEDVITTFGGLVVYAAQTFATSADITLEFDDLKQEGYLCLLRAYSKYRSKKDAEVRKLLKTAVWNGMLMMYQHVFSSHRILSINALSFREFCEMSDLAVNGIYIETAEPIAPEQEFRFNVPDVLVALTEQEAAFVREIVEPSPRVLAASKLRFERDRLRAMCGFIQREPQTYREPSISMIADVLGVGHTQVKRILEKTRQLVQGYQLVSITI